MLDTHYTENSLCFSRLVESISPALSLMSQHQSNRWIKRQISVYWPGALCIYSKAGKTKLGLSEDKWEERRRKIPYNHIQSTEYRIIVLHNRSDLHMWGSNRSNSALAALLIHILRKYILSTNKTLHVFCQKGTYGIKYSSGTMTSIGMTQFHAHPV